MLFSSNWAADPPYGEGEGGALYANGADVTLIHCTLWNNRGWNSGGLYTQSAQPLLVGCILWANEPQEIVDGADAATTVLYSNVRGGWPGEGNIDADPLFVYANPQLTNENLHLSPGSPCIDAADATALPAGVTTDLDGNPRLVDDPCTTDTGIPDANGLVPDMGAYEFPGESFPPGDLDGDCLVASGDVLLLLSAWGPCEDCSTPQACPADLDGDCAVGVTDLLIQLAGWS